MNNKRTILVYALVLLCNSNHSGQNSRGYRIMCRGQNWLYKFRQMSNIIDNWESKPYLLNKEFKKEVKHKMIELSIKFINTL